MKLIKLLLASSILLLSSCGIQKEFIKEKNTGMYVSAYELAFPPGAYHIRKEKEYWYSFERNGKKYLLFYPESVREIQIFEY